MLNQNTLVNGIPLTENQHITNQMFYDYPNYSNYPNYPNYLNVIKLPEVFITKNNDRLKKYTTNYVDICYLNNNDEFEIEFFNPSFNTFGIKIKIDNEYISNSHLVIDPGQRIHLNRYIDNNNKFLFRTYTVDGNNSDVQNAIKFNGDVTIEFYLKKPQQKHQKRFDHRLNNSSNFVNLDSFDQSNFCEISNSTFSQFTSGFSGSSVENFKSFEPIETGKIDEGSESKQVLQHVNMTFDSTLSYFFKFKLLPISQKPIEAKDLKITCTNCNKIIKKTHKFCSFCGTKK